MKSRFDVIIVGGGPAGMMAAITAADAGAHVLLCEQLRRPGAKLLATGGGRCNLTNVLGARELAERFGKNGRFMRSALAAMDGEGLRRFFDTIGVATHCPDGFHYFPESESSLAVRDALVRRCENAGVELSASLNVTALLYEAGRVTGVATPSGRLFAPAVVLATGGRSYPELGATGSGYEMAKSVGHTIVNPVPGLVSLDIAESWLGRSAGIALPDAEVRIDLPRTKIRESGIVLITHRGLSGPAVLDISGEVSALLPSNGKVPMRLNLVRELSVRGWLERFEDWQRREGRKMIRTLLALHLPASLAAVMCEQVGVADDTRAVSFRKQQRRMLAELLTSLRLTVTSTEGWDKAMVTRGGVALGEVDQRTLQSRLVHGLHFAGEVLDLDGPCGGFNLTWAFSSGRLAGESAARVS